MFIAMNQFQVNEGWGVEFEEVWRTRERRLQGVPGFRGFALLRGDDVGDYVLYMMWASREHFLAWTQSDAFRQAHAGRMGEGVLAGHPRARFYEAVLEEPAAAAPAS